MNESAPPIFSPSQAILVVVDMQEKLLPTIHEQERVASRAAILIKAARLLEVPILWAEQYRKGLGPTVPIIAEAIGEATTPFEKLHFGCLGDPAIAARAHQMRSQSTPGGRQMILCGIETHVCLL